jgi:lantibiotic modifying enzyme
VIDAELRQHLLRECWLLIERLQVAPRGDGEIDAELLVPWQKAIAPDVEAKFIDRLIWDGYSLQQATWAMNPPVEAMPDDAPWLSLLDKICYESRQLSNHLLDPVFYKERSYPLNVDKPLPFEDLFFPALEVARCHLINRFISCPFLSVAAKSDLESALLVRLSEVASPALFELFNNGRPMGRYLLAQALVGDPKYNFSEYYQAFIRQTTGDGLYNLLQAYPILGRIIANVVILWIESTDEFLQRLTSDWNHLKDYFCRNSLPLGIVNIQINISDHHRGGRTVCIVVFDGGNKVVYKPKDLGLEKAYNSFLEWCNRSMNLPRTFKTLAVLQKNGYGWVEFVEHRPCKNSQQRQLFYDQSGALLAVLYLLGANDCHYENLIACDEDLVLIDTETLLTGANQKCGH